MGRNFLTSQPWGLMLVSRTLGLGVMMKPAAGQRSLDDHRAAYGVEPICRGLPIAPSTSYAHAAGWANPGRLAARARSDAARTAEIRRIFEENFHAHGVRKVWRRLGREGGSLVRSTG